MIRGSAGGWVGGRTVTVITLDVTASGGLGTGTEVSSCQWGPDPGKKPRRYSRSGAGGHQGAIARERPRVQWGPGLHMSSRAQSNSPSPQKASGSPCVPSQATATKVQEAVEGAPPGQHRLSPPFLTWVAPATLPRGLTWGEAG